MDSIERHGRATIRPKPFPDVMARRGRWDDRSHGCVMQWPISQLARRRRMLWRVYNHGKWSIDRLENARAPIFLTPKAEFISAYWGVWGARARSLFLNPS